MKKVKNYHTLYRIQGKMSVQLREDDMQNRYKYVSEMRNVLVMGGLSLRSATIDAILDLFEEGISVDGVLEILNNLKQTKTLAVLMSKR